MTFPGGDAKLIKLDDLVANAPVPDDTFRLAP
jgi:hypothetical protein